MRLQKPTAAMLALILFGSLPAGADTPPAATAPAAPPPAAAAKPDAGKGATITIHMDPAAKAANEAYDAAIKPLTAEQRATLKTLEDEFSKTIDGDLQIVDMGYKAKFCAQNAATAIGKDPAKYQSEYGVFSNQVQTRQQALRNRLHDKRVAATPFIDQKVLDGHYRASMMMLGSLGVQMITLAYNNGGFAKTDCADTAAKLDAAFAEANKAAPAGAPNNAQQGAAEIKTAADAGDVQALFTYGMMNITGNGVAKDVKTGLAYLTQSAEKGYDRAQFLLGLSYATDMLGMPPDKEKARLWLGKAAAQGNKKAAAMLASLDNQPPPVTLDELKKKAEAGEAEAEYLYGSRFSQGIGGVDKDLAEGKKWLLLAAGQGHPLAESDLAVLLLNEGKNDEGLTWMTKAAEANVSNSQYELAKTYADGRLVPQDKEKATLWAKKAATTGDSRATQLLQALDAGK